MVGSRIQVHQMDSSTDTLAVLENILTVGRLQQVITSGFQKLKNITITIQQKKNPSHGAFDYALIMIMMNHAYSYLATPGRPDDELSITHFHKTLHRVEDSSGIKATKSSSNQSIKL